MVRIFESHLCVNFFLLPLIVNSKDIFRQNASFRFLLYLPKRPSSSLKSWCGSQFSDIKTELALQKCFWIHAWFKTATETNSRNFLLKGSTAIISRIFPSGNDGGWRTNFNFIWFAFQTLLYLWFTFLKIVNLNVPRWTWLQMLDEAAYLFRNCPRKRTLGFAFRLKWMKPRQSIRTLLLPPFYGLIWRN